MVEGQASGSAKSSTCGSIAHTGVGVQFGFIKVSDNLLDGINGAIPIDHQ
jgi:hypothetical protein